MYLKLIGPIKKTLNPDKCRGIADAFLAHKQSLEVRKVQSINLTIFPLRIKQQTAVPSIQMKKCIKWLIVEGMTQTSSHRHSAICVRVVAFLCVSHQAHRTSRMVLVFPAEGTVG